MDEHDFRAKCDAALESLRRRLLELGDERGFEVEGEGDKLEVFFEEPEEARFVISPEHCGAPDLDFSAVHKLQAELVGCGQRVCAGEDRWKYQVMGGILTQNLSSPVEV